MPNPKTVIIASNNAHKAEEIAHALDFPGWEFRTLKEAHIDSDPAEDADSFLGNARIKAKAAWEAAKEALGHPVAVLRELGETPDEERTARFVCTLVFLDENGDETDAHGTVEGRIGHEERGEHGFGYDPLFLAEVFDFKRTLAEALPEEKNAISHRGNALVELREKLSR